MSATIAGPQIVGAAVFLIQHRGAGAASSTGHSPAGMTSPGCTRSHTLRSSFVSSTGPVEPQSWQVAVCILPMGASSDCRIGGAGGIRTREVGPSS